MTDKVVIIQGKLTEMKALQEEMNVVFKENFSKINKNAKEIIELLEHQVLQTQTQDIQTSVLLEIPDHMRKSLLKLMEKGEATAEEISDETERSRSLESAYLNSLANWGYVKKNRKGQLVYYSPNFNKLIEK